MEKKRSKGVTILGWLYLIENLIEIFRLILNTSFTAISVSSIGAMSPSEFIIAGVSVWVAWYLLKLKEWARKWIIYLMYFGIARLILYCVFGLPESVKNFNTNELWKIAVAICLALLAQFFYIYFFTRPKVKEQYKKE